MEKLEIVSLKMLCYRVYATNDCFYDPDDSKKIKPLLPLIINDFPDKEWKLTCFFGEVPEEIKNVHNSVKGFGLLCIQMIGNALDNTKPALEYLEECIHKVKSESTVFTEYKWYIVEVFEKDIDIQKCEIVDPDSGETEYNISKFTSEDTMLDRNFVYPAAKVTLFGGELLNFLAKEKEKIKSPELFDKISICLMTELPTYFFTKLIDQGCALIINGTYVVGKPNFTCTANLEVLKKYKLLDQDKLISLIKQKGPGLNKWLNSVSHWYMAMIREEDKWKKFYFGFICLEILTHKMFKKIYQNNQFDVHLKNNEGYDKLVEIPISDIIPEDINRMTIAAKFSFVAGVLNPEKYSNDRLIFKKCKDARDKISHGEIITIEELPVAELGTLLEFYTQKMVMYD
ncbi:MAG: hypothetical protein STSR0009_14440 [Methanoregula sp.]